MSNYIAWQYYNSPCGRLILASFNDKLCLCDWVINHHRATTDSRLLKTLNAKFIEITSEIISKTSVQLDEYFRGQRQIFEIPLQLIGTDFQRTVWTNLLNIPYGTTSCYSDIAKSINRPKSVRAVANAIGSNPISIIIPCHRIISQNGSLTGYAGGIEAKHYLLSYEKGIISF